MNITEEDKEKLESLLFNMSSDRNYWFVRTMSGDYYEEFVKKGFVALGYNNVLMKDLKDLPEKEEHAREFIKRRLKEKNEDLTPSQIAKAAGQILKFYRNVSTSDIVVIPSENSNEFAIGTFIGPMYEDSSLHLPGECQFVKRRRVRWLRRIPRYQFDPKLLLGLSSQQTMSSVKNYSEYIDRKIMPLYTKDDQSYLVLRVKQDKGLSWDDFCFLADLGELFKTISEESGIDADLTQIKMKINVQSPGDILLSCGKELGYLLPLAIAAICIFGGKIKVWKFEFESRGIGPLFQQITRAITEYRDHNLQRKMVQENRLKNLDLELNPVDSTVENGSESSEDLLSPGNSEDGTSQTE